MKLSNGKRGVQEEVCGIHHQDVALLEQRQAVARRYERCWPGTPRIGLQLCGRYFRFRFWDTNA